MALIYNDKLVSRGRRYRNSNKFTPHKLTEKIKENVTMLSRDLAYLMTTKTNGVIRDVRRLKQMVSANFRTTRELSATSLHTSISIFICN